MSGAELKSCLKMMKIFNDPIHGHIEVHPLLVKIIDTPQFQRLRHIKQLGGAHWVFPGATHTRFEHSIGVAYLAGCLLKCLQEKQPELNIDRRDSLCVQIAGLCRDLGHGPFSHLFHKMFIPEVESDADWTDQTASIKMFQYMIDINSLRDVMEKDLILSEDLPFIEELIKGTDTSASTWKLEGRTKEKSFLYEIVANKRNGIDVDRWDYFARDCHYLGISNGFNHGRLLKSARVCEVEIEGNEKRRFICFRDKDTDSVSEMFRTRYILHRQVYQHKTVSITEVMIKNALKQANGTLKISAAIHDMEKYTKLTDNIFEKILSLTDGSLKEHLEDIVNRRLPKFVGQATIPEVEEKNILKMLNDNWKEAVKKWKNLNKGVALNADDFLVNVVQIDHGMKDKNPLDNVYFYRKSHPNDAFKAKEYQLSSCLPETFSEKLVRVYYKKKKNNTILEQEEAEKEAKMITDAEACFQQWCKDDFGLPALIIFYEDKNFKGKHYRCEMQCKDLPKELKRCNSFRVVIGTWNVFLKRNLPGQKIVLGQGKYNATLWEGPDDYCACMKHSWRIQLFEQEDFGGEMCELTVDCPSFEKRIDSISITEFRSCKVIRGRWKYFTNTDYKGLDYSLEEMEYRKISIKSIKSEYSNFKGFN